MKILKLPENVIYNTEKPNKMKFNRVPLTYPTPLQNVTTEPIFDFLSEHFRPMKEFPHPIFRDIGNSYFYCVGV